MQCSAPAFQAASRQGLHLTLFQSTEQQKFGLRKHLFHKFEQMSKRQTMIMNSFDLGAKMLSEPLGSSRLQAVGAGAS